MAIALLPAIADFVITFVITDVIKLAAICNQLVITFVITDVITFVITSGNRSPLNERKIHIDLFSTTPRSPPQFSVIAGMPTITGLI
jgi:hypothetical protein